MARPVCILSIGRSGTSLAARAVNVLGIDLGPERTMLDPTADNPRGFWEQRAIVDLNDAVLAALGGSYHEPPARPAGWETAPEMQQFRTAIGELVARHFEPGRRWGFKDPRTAMTLPLWRSVVGEFDYVICVRNPLEVAASLRPVVPPETDAVELWLTYMCESLRQTAGRHRAFVFYDEWFADPVAVGRRLATFLHDTLDPAAEERIRGLVEPGLRRHCSDDLAERTDVPVAARVLHVLMPELAAAETAGEDRAPALQAIAAAQDEWVSVARRQARERGRAEAELADVRAALATIESSRSWRLTAPLRGLARRLRSRGTVAA